MNEQTTVLSDKNVITFTRVVLVFFIIYLGSLSLSTFKSLRFIGAGVPATNTISVSGAGSVFAVPDTAEFTVTVIESAADVKSAQSAATTKANAITNYLKQAGVDAKDIQTTDYSVSPQYDYPRTSICGASDVNCPPRQVLTGYQVIETLDVKVRDTTKAGDLLAGVGGKGASQVSGLNFTVADQSALESEARDKAIADAKAKANILAKSLGVSLVRIVGYREDGSGPIPYAAKMSVGMVADSMAAPVPQISVGQNKITSNITLSYEIQ